MSRVWVEAFPIHTYELDPSQRVAIPYICNFLQEAAGHNAHALGFSVPQLLEKNLTWVLSRLLIRIREYPCWKDSLTVQTWPSGLNRLFALRDFRLLLGEREIGAATSAWLMLDARTRRPVRPESYGDWRSLIHEERALPDSLEKLPALDDPQGCHAAQSAAGSGAGAGTCLLERDLWIRYCDLDMNAHANNVRYVEWLLEGIPVEIRRKQTLTELEINFLSEAGYGERLACRCQPSLEAPGAYRHSLLRSTDFQELARARSLWAGQG